MHFSSKPGPVTFKEWFYIAKQHPSEVQLFICKMEMTILTPFYSVIVKIKEISADKAHRKSGMLVDTTNLNKQETKRGPLDSQPQLYSKLQTMPNYGVKSDLKKVNKQKTQKK